MTHRDEIADLLHRRDRPELYCRPIEAYEQPPERPLLARLWWLPLVMLAGAAWIVVAAVIALLIGGAG